MFISEDIIAAEILPRLPVKSLLKFRCVCKSWCSLISDDKNFIKSHHQKHSKNINVIASFDHRPIDHVERKGNRNSTLIRYDEPSSISDFTIIDGNGYTNQSKDYVCLVGTSSNGLCCILIGKKFFVWNPATKISYKLPSLVSLLLTQTNTRAISMIAGFGFNEANNHYKVLSLICCHQDNDTVIPLLYSSTTNSWKVVENLRGTKNFTYSPMKFLNGNLHWQGRQHDRSSIYCFDLERELAGLIEGPNSMKLSASMSIGILDGYLSCTHRCFQETEVWIMKSYGVKESWHLVEIIKTSYVVYTPSWYQQDRITTSSAVYTPLCLAKDGKMLFYYNRGLMVYDPKTKVCRPSKLDESGAFYAGIYVESLVTPVPVGAATTRRK